MHLEDTSRDDLQEQLHDTDDPQAVLRLVVALNLQDDISPDTIADWYDISRQTAYNWKNRFEERDLLDAMHDRSRSGRNPRLSTDDRDELDTLLQDPPTEAGLEAPAWTTPLVQSLIEDRYGVAYSLRQVRRILREAGLSYRKARPQHREADPEEQAAFQDDVKKTSGHWTRT